MIIEKYKLGSKYLGCLALVLANSNYKNNEYITDIIKSEMFDNNNIARYLEDLGLIEYIKTGRKDPWFRIRLSKKGKEIIKSLYGDNKTQHENAESLANELSEIYNNYDLGYKVVDMNKTIKNISYWLMYKENEQGISYNNIKFKALIEAYIESKDYDSRKFLNETHTLFFKPDSRFTKNWSVDNCPIEGFLAVKANKIKVKEKMDALKR